MKICNYTNTYYISFKVVVIMINKIRLSYKNIIINNFSKYY